jgi:hypothetical protein
VTESEKKGNIFTGEVVDRTSKHNNQKKGYQDEIKLRVHYESYILLQIVNIELKP